MYTINSVPLDNTTFGWSLLRRTQLIGGVTKRLTNIEIPGRNGVLSGVTATRAPNNATLVIRTPGSNVETLYALFEQNGGVGTLALAADATRNAVFELTSIDAQGLTAFDALVDVTVNIRFPTAQWRAATETVVAPAAVSTAIQNYTFFSGISSDIRDARVVITGQFGNFQLDDVASGSWLKTVKTWTYAAGNGLLYVGSTGQAFRVATANPWTPLEDITDMIDTSGGGGFRMTPKMVGTDPSNRRVELKLTTTSQSGVTMGLRAYNAYSMRNGSI